MFPSTRGQSTRTRSLTILIRQSLFSDCLPWPILTLLLWEINNFYTAYMGGKRTRVAIQRIISGQRNNNIKRIIVYFARVSGRLLSSPANRVDVIR